MIHIKQNVKQKINETFHRNFSLKTKSIYMYILIKTLNELTELDKQFLQECDSYNQLQGFHSFYNIYIHLLSKKVGA